MGKPKGYACAVFRVLQFLQGAFFDSMHSGYGSGVNEDRVDSPRFVERVISHTGLWYIADLEAYT